MAILDRIRLLKYKKRVVGAFVFIVLYVVSYCVLSTYGEYTPTQSGLLRYKMGLSVTDSQHWQAKYTNLRIYYDIEGDCAVQGGFLGYFYFPLIALDRKYVHHTLRNDEWETWKHKHTEK